jgi:hypothetical protein
MQITLPYRIRYRCAHGQAALPDPLQARRICAVVPHMPYTLSFKSVRFFFIMNRAPGRGYIARKGKLLVPAKAQAVFPLKNIFMAKDRI